MGTYTYTVPTGVTQLGIDMAGAACGDSYNHNGKGGQGGRVLCNLTVSGGQVLNIYVAASAETTSAVHVVLMLRVVPMEQEAPQLAAIADMVVAPVAVLPISASVEPVLQTGLSLPVAVAAVDLCSDNGGVGGGTNGGNGTECGSYYV